MKTYVVGGAVRDRLLGLDAPDRDHVVVGATPEQMQALGYVPVGRDFPVFLHPITHEEYALARTERKTAPGYGGFIFHADADVTLEEDLVRRDLTINAIAQDSDGSLIDPYHGQDDLAAKVFRHVGAAFAEDPVRILRVARFAARFADFTVAPETLELMRHMVACGEVDALVAERVWQEWERGLMEATPSRMLEVLDACGALSRLLPLHDSGPWSVLDAAAREQAPLAVRFALWMRTAAPSAEDLAEVVRRYRVPLECRDLAALDQIFAPLFAARSAELAVDAATQLDVIERSDALRRPERFAALLMLLGIGAAHSAQYGTAIAALQQALVIVRGVDGAVVARQAQGGDIRSAMHRARLDALLTRR